MMATHDVTAQYSPREERPLAGYAGLVAVFNAVIVGSLVGLRAKREALPERVAAGDLALLGVATFKLSRLIAKDKVTSFLRAPFTEYEESAGHGEVKEKPRGHGLQLAIGELLVCPYCIGQWVATALGLGYVANPRATRLAASTLTLVAIADALQLAWKAAEEKT